MSDEAEKNWVTYAAAAVAGFSEVGESYSGTDVERIADLSAKVADLMVGHQHARSSPSSLVAHITLARNENEEWIKVAYEGSQIFDFESGVWHGKILNIEDLITYEGRNQKELSKAFCDAVNELHEANRIAHKQEGGKWV